MSVRLNLGVLLAGVFYCAAGAAAQASEAAPVTCPGGLLDAFTVGCDGRVSIAPSTQADTSAPYVDNKAVWKRYDTGPRVFSFNGPYAPGSLLLDTQKQYLYFVETGGRATRYTVVTGMPGYVIPDHLRISHQVEGLNWNDGKGNRNNPLWARGPAGVYGIKALILADGATGEEINYAIHGTNRPELLGKPDGQRRFSHGCVRAHNSDILGLAGKVRDGASVRVFREGELARYLKSLPRVASAEHSVLR